MNPKPGSCRGCVLETRGTGYVPFFSSLPKPLILGVGEAPGSTEALQGIPFVGRSGLFLDRLFRQAGVARAEWGFHNALSCQPPKNELRGMPYRNDALYKCSPNLDQTIERLEPKVIMAFGDTALERLTGKSGIQRHRGFFFFGPRGIPVMPTFHPAYLLPGRTKGELRKDRPGRFVGAVLWDIIRAYEAAQQGGFKRATKRYLVDPPPRVFADFAREYKNALANQGPKLMMTFDIETPGKAAKGETRVPMLEQPIIRLSFAFEAHYAVSVRWSPEYLETIQELLRTEGITTGWNSASFDNPILMRHMNGSFLRGTHYDMMRAWHVLQSDLPKGLEFVASFFTDLFPWKDLSGSDPGTYSAIDADAQIQNSYGIRDALQPRGQWEVYNQLVQGLIPFMKAAGDRGLPVDVAAQNLLREELTRDLSSEYILSQAEVPARFYTEKIYVREPKRTHTPIVRGREIAVCSACGKERPTAVHYRATKTRDACPGVPVPQVRELQCYLAVMDLDPDRGLAYLRDEISECGFNPLSPLQLTQYADSFRHLQLLRSSGLKADSVDDTVLSSLVRRFGGDHPIYARVLSIREKAKKLGTYVEGYAPNAAGNVTTTFNDNPSTLRFGSQDVNLQNVHAEIKKTIRAPKGWRIVECDSAALQAVLWGYMMQNPKYIRLAAQGVHDFVCAKRLGLEWDYPTVLKITKDKVNKLLRDAMKEVVHGTNFGLKPNRLFNEHQELFASEREAYEFQRFYLGVCPEVEQGQKKIRAEVARTNVLVNAWGFHQYFYEVFDGNNPGDDFNRVLAAGPQSMEACFMRENLCELRDSQWAQYAGGNVSTHDSLGLVLPDEFALEGGQYLLEVLTRPIPQLDNLRLGAELKMSDPGGTWAEMKEVKTIRFEDPLELSRWHRGLEGR